MSLTFYRLDSIDIHEEYTNCNIFTAYISSKPEQGHYAGCLIITKGVNSLAPEGCNCTLKSIIFKLLSRVHALSICSEIAVW